MCHVSQSLPTAAHGKVILGGARGVVRAKGGSPPPPFRGSSPPPLAWPLLEPMEKNLVPSLSPARPHPSARPFCPPPPSCSASCSPVSHPVSTKPNAPASPLPLLHSAPPLPTAPPLPPTCGRPSLLRPSAPLLLVPGKLISADSRGGSGRGALTGGMAAKRISPPPPANTSSTVAATTKHLPLQRHPSLPHPHVPPLTSLPSPTPPLAYPSLTSLPSPHLPLPSSPSPHLPPSPPLTYPSLTSLPSPLSPHLPPLNSLPSPPSPPLTYPSPYLAPLTSLPSPAPLTSSTLGASTTHLALPLRTACPTSFSPASTRRLIAPCPVRRCGGDGEGEGDAGDAPPHSSLLPCVLYPEVPVSPSTPPPSPPPPTLALLRTLPPAHALALPPTLARLSRQHHHAFQAARSLLIRCLPLLPPPHTNSLPRCCLHPSLHSASPRTLSHARPLTPFPRFSTFPARPHLSPPVRRRLLPSSAFLLPVIPPLASFPPNPNHAR
ncbi:unnamed protein product [Closterium sp. NIES-65]|nr:unnamed protein product [Closterium sp. NIES-65]